MSVGVLSSTACGKCEMFAVRFPPVSYASSDDIAGARASGPGGWTFNRFGNGDALG